MNTLLKNVLAAALVAAAAQVSAQITLYENEAFEGRSFNTERTMSTFQRTGFNNRASSAVVVGRRWEVCEDRDFGGRCVVLRPGRYASLTEMGLNNRVSSVRDVSRRGGDRAAAATSVPKITFYEQQGFGGRTLVTQKDISDFRNARFNDRASSAVVAGGYWEICDSRGYKGRCVTLRPGQYATLAAMGLDGVTSVRAVTAPPEERRAAAAPEGSSQVTFYQNEGFAGRTFIAQQTVDDFRRQGFNDRASSAVVVGQPWEVCDAAGFAGRCVVLRPGQYPSLSAMGLNNSVSSVRSVDTNARGAERRQGNNDYRRRDNEQLYQADVLAVRAVVGTAEQRCWVEREQVSQNNSTEAVIGAVIGSILGHQVGDARDVQRCTTVPRQDRPDYWDVTYVFRGQQHRIQMSTPPGQTVTVNSQGEPRS